MAMSGVELDQECKKIYDEVQSKKKHRYVTFKIDDGKIRVDKVSFGNLILYTAKGSEGARAPSLIFTHSGLENLK